MRNDSYRTHSLKWGLARSDNSIENLCDECLSPFQLCDLALAKLPSSCNDIIHHCYEKVCLCYSIL